MPIGARSARLPSRVVAPLVVSAFIAIAVAAVGASAANPSSPAPVPDAAFGPVVLLPGIMASPKAPGLAPTPGLGVVHDPWVASAPPERAQPALPAASPVIISRSTPTPAKPTSHRITGAASWYCRTGASPCTSGYPDDGGVDAYAAAGPRLRAAIGSGWRGKVVLVDGIRVKLIDWCQCHQGESNEKLLDLYYDVFARTGSSVTIRW